MQLLQVSDIALRSALGTGLGSTLGEAQLAAALATARAAAGATGLEDAGLPEISTPSRAAEHPAQADKDRAEESEAGPSQVRLPHTAHVAGSLARQPPVPAFSPGKFFGQCIGVLQQASAAYDAVKSKAAAAGQPALEALSLHVGEPARRQLQSLVSSTRAIVGAVQGNLASFSPSRAAAAAAAASAATAATQHAQEQQRSGSPVAAGEPPADPPPSPLKLLMKLGPEGLQAFQRMHEGTRTDRRMEPAALGGPGRASRGAAPAGPDRPSVAGKEQAPRVAPFQRTRAPGGAKRKSWAQQLGGAADVEEQAGPGPGAAAAAEEASPGLGEPKPKRARKLVLADELPGPLAAGGALQHAGPGMARPAMVPQPPEPNPLVAGFASVLNGMTDMRAAVALFWQIPTPDQKAAVFICLRRELQQSIAPAAMVLQR